MGIKRFEDRQLYVAIDNTNITKAEFDEAYDQARRTRAAIRSPINCLTQYEQRAKTKTVRASLATYGTQTVEP